LLIRAARVAANGHYAPEFNLPSSGAIFIVSQLGTESVQR